MDDDFPIVIGILYILAIVLFGSCAMMTMDSCIDLNRQATKTLEVIEKNGGTITVTPKTVFQVPEIKVELPNEENQ